MATKKAAKTVKSTKPADVSGKLDNMAGILAAYMKAMEKTLSVITRRLDRIEGVLGMAPSAEKPEPAKDDTRPWYWELTPEEAVGKILEASAYDVGKDDIVYRVVPSECGVPAVMFRFKARTSFNGVQCSVDENGGIPLHPEFGRAVNAFDTLVGNLMFVTFKRKGEKPGKPAEPAAHVKPAKPAGARKIRTLGTLSPREVLGGLLELSGYDIPKNRVAAGDIVLNRKHQYATIPIHFWSKVPRKGVSASSEDIVFHIYFRRDDNRTMAERFDKAVAGLKTVRFSRKAK